jgi:hypothetical protein
MGKLTKILLSTVMSVVGIGLLHAWLNLGFDPLSALGVRKGVPEETRFRVGFLPVT